MKRLLGFVVVLFAVLGSTAHAAPPLLFTNQVSFGGVVPASANPCAFPIHHSRVGSSHYSIHERSPGSGSWGFTRHEDFVETYTNLLTGESVQARVLRTGNSVFETAPTTNPDGTITFVDAFHGLYSLDRFDGGGVIGQPLAGHWESFFTVDPVTGRVLSKGFVTVPNGFTGWLGVPTEICAAIG